MSEVLLKALGPRPEETANGALIADRILQAITSGSLPVGTQVRQQVLADHFSVSRMPVREALRQLQAQGVITAPRYRTPVVAELPTRPAEPLDVLNAKLEELIAQLAEAREVVEQCLGMGDLPTELEWKAMRVVKGRRVYIDDRAQQHVAQQACA